MENWLRWKIDPTDMSDGVVTPVKKSVELLVSCSVGKKEQMLSL